MAHAAEDNHSATPVSPSTNDITLEPLSPPASPPNLDSEGLQVYEPIQCSDKVTLSPDSQDDRNISGGNLQISLSPDAYSKHTDGYVPEAERPNWRKRRICCMPRTIFWILIAMLMLAGVGGIIGGVLAGMKSSSSNGEADTTTQGVFSTTTTSINTSTNESLSTSMKASTTRSTNDITTNTAARSTITSADPTGNGLFRSDAWYRFTNKFLGENFALDILRNNGSNSRNLTMSSGDNTGQYWQILPVPPSIDPFSSSGHPQTLFYWLSSSYLGQSKRLQVEDPSSIEPYMAQANDTHLGQMWRFTQWNFKDDKGTWALSNGVNEGGWDVTLYWNTHILYMAEDSEDTSQRWIVEMIPLG